MAAGSLLRAEANITVVSDGRLFRAELAAVAAGRLVRAEFSASSSTAGQLLRAEMVSALAANGRLFRSELNSSLFADGLLYRAELSSAFVPVSAGPPTGFIEPWSTVTLQGTGGNPTPSVVVWSQTGGPTVALSPSGDRCTFVAPSVQTTLTFQYSVDGAAAEVTRTVLPATESDVVSVLRPVRPVG